MYVSINGDPFSEVASLHKTFIPEPLLPGEDECLIALLPLPTDTVVLTAVDDDEVEHILRCATARGVAHDDIDWCVVDREHMEDIIMAHLRAYRGEELDRVLEQL